MNPFEAIDARLSNIESLLLDLKQRKQPTIPQPEAPDLLSVIETANLLKVSVPTIYGYSHRKILGKKRMKGCRKIFFSRMEVMKLLDAGRTKTNAELEQEANDHVAFKK